MGHFDDMALDDFSSYLKVPHPSKGLLPSEVLSKYLTYDIDSTTLD